MRKVILIFIPAFLLAFAGMTFSQSLAEMAKKEKERREKIGASQPKVITNQDPSKVASTNVTIVPQSEPAPAKATAEKPEKKDADKSEKEAATKPETTSKEPVDLNGRPESYWRRAAAEARKKIRDLEDERNVLILKVADLRNRAFAESDGFKQQQLQRDLNNAMFFQNLNETRLTAAKEELSELLADARKSGALPGWLEEKPSKP